MELNGIAFNSLVRTCFNMERGRSRRTLIGTAYGNAVMAHAREWEQSRQRPQMENVEMPVRGYVKEPFSKEAIAHLDSLPVPQVEYAKYVNKAAAREGPSSAGPSTVERTIEYAAPGTKSFELPKQESAAPPQLLSAEAYVSGGAGDWALNG